MIRLLHVTTLPQTAASFLQGQLSWLRRHGMQITIVSSPGAQLQEFANQEGIEWAAVPLSRSISPVADAVAIGRLSAILQQQKPHIVHAHTPKAGMVGMVAATLCQVPVRIYHLHGLRFETAQGMRRRCLRAVEKFTCQLAQRVFCVSPSLRNRAISERLIRENQSVVLGHGSINGLDLQQFQRGSDYVTLRQTVRGKLRIPDDALCIGFVGRLVRDKGIIDLHAAWQRLRAEFPTAHLLLVGPFESGDAVPQHVRSDLSADPRVHLTGLDWNCRPYYAAMDVFALPSHREGLGIVLLEAAAMQLPVVTCRVTGCIDAVAADTTGRVVPVRDPVALSGAIAAYLKDPNLRRAHGDAGRRFVAERFRPDVIWQAMYQEYARMLSTTREQAPRPHAAVPLSPLTIPTSAQSCRDIIDG